jgi:branched-chain amino acid transport system ATP-binding protein
VNTRRIRRRLGSASIFSRRSARPPRESGPLLEAAGISKSFGGVAAVDQVTLRVESGELLGLVGPNGAGKTTLFNCICGQLRQDSGTVTFDGVVLDGLPTYKRARLGIGRTYQRIEVYPELTVHEHLMVAERARRGDGRLWKDLCNRSADRPEELRRVDEVLELIGLGEVQDTPVSALGLGLCRLVELARAVVCDPVLLVADEPSSGLDVNETAELSQVLRTLQTERGTAVLLVEHDLGMVADVVDRAVVMDLGRIVADGAFEKVMALPEVRYAYLGVNG